MKQILALGLFIASLFFTGNVVFAQNACGIQATPVSPVGCFGSSTGSIDLQLANPGVPAGYTYAWSNGATTQDLNNIPAGTYTVTITYQWNGQQGCQSASNPIIVSQPAFSLGVNTAATPVKCFGGNDGSIQTDVWGGTPGYSYHWSNGSTLEDPTGLAAGTYFVTVTDANGCIQTGAASVGQPSPLQTAITKTDGSCGQTGSMMATTIGGTQPYSYSWSNGMNSPSISNLATGVYTVTVTDAHLCTKTASASITGGGTGISPNVSGTCNGANITNLAPGTYTMTITNANGCTATATFTVACNLTVTASATNVSCNGGNNGAVNLSVTGGTMPYTFHWNTGSSNQNLANLPAGTYTVTVTDANGSTKTTSATVSQPSAINVSLNVTNVSVNGGSNGAINLNVSGGTPGYTFHWSNNAWTEDVFNLSAGSYTVTVTDVNGCTIVLSATVSQPAPCIAPHASFAASSPTGFIAYCANLSTGTNLSYHWWFGDGNESFEENPTHTYAQTGMYLITLKVTNECGQNSETKNLLISGGPTDITEPGSGDVSLTVSPNPTTDWMTLTGTPTGTYTVTITDITGKIVLSVFGQDELDVSGLPAGVYAVTVTDANGGVVVKKLVKQ